MAAYRYISSKEKINIKTYKPVFTAIADAIENNKPIYLHCWGGLDRAGCVFFMLGGLLGMSFTDLCADYEMSSFSKALRERDKANSSSNTFPGFIKAFYNNEMGWDENNNLDVQTICRNGLLYAGLTNAQLDTIVNGLLK